MAVSDGQILMFIAVLVAAWYLLGSETCSGCVDECRAMGSSKAACQDKCAKKGVCSFASVTPLTCKDCMANCSKNLGSTYDACKKACEASGCEGTIASQVVVPSQPIAPSPPKSMGMALRGAGAGDDDKSWY